MSDKVYVVLESGWEYNDEIYYTPDSCGGNPKCVFEDKKLAQEYADEITAKHLAGMRLGDYCYSITDIVDEDKMSKLLSLLAVSSKPIKCKCGKLSLQGDLYCSACGKSANNVFKGNRDLIIPSNLPDETYVKIAKLVDIDFCKVVEVQKCD